MKNNWLRLAPAWATHTKRSCLHSGLAAQLKARNFWGEERARSRLLPECLRPLHCGSFERSAVLHVRKLRQKPSLEDRKECYCRRRSRKTEFKPSATFDTISIQWTPCMLPR